jgi:hypothetical protein
MLELLFIANSVHQTGFDARCEEKWGRRRERF